jgi:hypothetical protein
MIADASLLFSPSPTITSTCPELLEEAECVAPRISS